MTGKPPSRRPGPISRLHPDDIAAGVKCGALEWRDGSRRPRYINPAFTLAKNTTPPTSRLITNCHDLSSHISSFSTPLPSILSLLLHIHQQLVQHTSMYITVADYTAFFTKVLLSDELQDVSGLRVAGGELVSRVLTMGVSPSVLIAQSLSSLIALLARYCPFGCGPAPTSDVPSVVAPPLPTSPAVLVDDNLVVDSSPDRPLAHSLLHTARHVGVEVKEEKLQMDNNKTCVVAVGLEVGPVSEDFAPENAHLGLKWRHTDDWAAGAVRLLLEATSHGRLQARQVSKLCGISEWVGYVDARVLSFLLILRRFLSVVGSFVAEVGQQAWDQLIRVPDPVRNAWRSVAHHVRRRLWVTPQDIRSPTVPLAAPVLRDAIRPGGVWMVCDGVKAGWAAAAIYVGGMLIKCDRLWCPLGDQPQNEAEALCLGLRLALTCLSYASCRQLCVVSDLEPLVYACVAGYSNAPSFSAVPRHLSLLTPFTDGVLMFHVTSENNIVDGYSRTEDKPPSSSPYYSEPHLTRLFGKVPEDVYLGPHPYDCVPTQQHWSQVVELAGAVPDIEAFSSPEQPPLCTTRWSARDDFFRQLPATPPSSLIYANPPFPMLPQVIQALQSWNGTAVVVALRGTTSLTVIPDGHPWRDRCSAPMTTGRPQALPWNPYGPISCDPRRLGRDDSDRRAGGYLVLADNE